ncbi:MAG: DUF4350 domain-containing protein [Desulfurococcaceae archaeon TW002]
MRAVLSRLVVVIFLMALLVEPFPVGVVLSGASPNNTGYDGTSRLKELLEDLGYDVRLVDSWILAQLYPSFSSCSIVLIVSPEKPFTPDEVGVIAWLVKSGSGLVIADEGIYSNAVLEALGSNVRISGEYVSFGGSYVFHGIVNVSGSETLLYFAYASRVKSSDGVVVAYRGNVVLGVRTNVGGRPVYVFGDGSVMTNAALTSLSLENPYARLIKEVFSSICSDGIVYVDSSKYGLRPLTTSELMSSDFTYFIAALSNPFRYFLTFSETLDAVSLSIISLFLLFLFSFSIVSRLLPWKGISTMFGESIPRLKRRSYVLSGVRALVCSDEAPDKLRVLCGGGKSRLGATELAWLLSRVSTE